MTAALAGKHKLPIVAAELYIKYTRSYMNDLRATLSNYADLVPALLMGSELGKSIMQKVDAYKAKFESDSKKVKKSLDVLDEEK